jgi:hypothetical protein
VKESALYQKVLKPKNLTETNPQVIFDATIEGIQAGVLDPQQAARDYSTLFKAAVDSNNKMNGGFRRLGMPDQKEYNTMITRPPSYLESDLANLRLLPTTFTAGIVAPFSSALSDKLNAAANYSKRNAPNLREVIDVTDVTKVQHRIIQALNTAKPKNPSSAPSTTLTTK